MPEVEIVAAGFTGPYANSNWGSGTRLAGGREVDYGVNNVTDDYLELLHIPLVAGRWFSREDDAATWTPVVVNRRLAREIFGDANPVGQIIPEERDPERPAAGPRRQAGDQARHRRGRRVPAGRRAVGDRQLPVFPDAARRPGPEGGAARAPVRAAATRHHGRLRRDARQARHGGRGRLVVRGAAARRHARGQAAPVHDSARASSARSPRSCC